MNEPVRRKAVELPVELFVQPTASPVLGLTVNLSETGMLVITEGPAPERTEVRFRSTGFEGRAEVAWAYPGEMESLLLGMRFTELTDGARREIESVLRSAEREYRPAGLRPHLRS